uniref:Putative secreted protein n=1 Tax=Rhipicephalus microplus TaxID=6941 RepID=A0A6G5A0D7_RHIMP
MWPGFFFLFFSFFSFFGRKSKVVRYVPYGFGSDQKTKKVVRYGWSVRTSWSAVVGRLGRNRNGGRLVS